MVSRISEMSAIPEFKVILVGDSAVGKTSLLIRFTEDKFYERRSVTVPIDIKSVSLDISGKECLMHIYDTGGQENFYSLAKSYFRGADGVILVYDETRTHTFDNIPYWFHCIEENCDDKIVKILAGNKIDDEARIPVLSSRVRTCVEGKHVEVIKTSAKNDTNVKEAFLLLIKLMAISREIVKAGEEPVIQVLESSSELLTAMDESTKSYKKEKRARFVNRYSNLLKGIRIAPSPEQGTQTQTQSTQTQGSVRTTCPCALI